MKKLLSILILLPLMIYANPANLSSVVDAINSGDADKLSAFLDAKEEISIFNKEEVYDKAKAIEVLKDFFGKNKPSSFQMMHSGSSKGKSSNYAIGSLVAGGKKFRVFIYMKEAGSSVIIEQLQFELE